MLGYAIVIGGGLLVLLGGVVARWGWNIVVAHDQKTALLHSLGRELSLNEKLLSDALYNATHWNGTPESTGFSYQPYRSEQTDVLLTSAHFSFSRTEDRRLLEVGEQYRGAVTDFNAALRIVGRHNPGLFVRVEFVHDPKLERPTDEAQLLAPQFGRLVSVHRDFKAALSTQYPGSLDTDARVESTDQTQR